MKVVAALSGLLMPALMVAMFVFFWKRRSVFAPPAPPPPEAFTAPADPGWVRVTGQVGSLQALGVGGWPISYPARDGGVGQLTVPFTRPSALREGMAVPVLVNAATGEARLDLPAHDRIINTVKIGWIVVGATVAGLVLWVLAFQWMVR